MYKVLGIMLLLVTCLRICLFPVVRHKSRDRPQVAFRKPTWQSMVPSGAL